SYLPNLICQIPLAKHLTIAASPRRVGRFAALGSVWPFFMWRLIPRFAAPLFAAPTLTLPGFSLPLFRVPLLRVGRLWAGWFGGGWLGGGWFGGCLVRVRLLEQVISVGVGGCRIGWRVRGLC